MRATSTLLCSTTSVLSHNLLHREGERTQPGYELNQGINKLGKMLMIFVISISKLTETARSGEEVRGHILTVYLSKGGESEIDRIR